MTIGMVGVHNSSFPVNLVHLWNGGPEEGWLAVQLKRGTGVQIEAFKERLRGVLAKELPDVRLSFEPQDIVTRVMSFGSPTPIEIAVSGPSLAGEQGRTRRRLLAKLQEAPLPARCADRADARFPDRECEDQPRARRPARRECRGRHALARRRDDIEPLHHRRIYWADPGTGISFNLQVQIPEERTQTHRGPEERAGHRRAAARPCCCATSRTSTTGTAVGTYERYNMARVVSITANIHGTDLGTAIARNPQGDRRGRTCARRQDEGGCARPGRAAASSCMDGFRSGLIIAVLVIFLMLMANFQSVRLALAVVSTVPAVLAGVVLALWLTGTTLNIQSAMGAIMAVGVAVANAILLVTFAEKARVAQRRSAAPPPSRARAAACGRS